MSAGKNGARLTIHVTSPQVRRLDDVDALMMALETARPWLRREISQEIHRKRTPDIVFQLIFALDGAIE